MARITPDFIYNAAAADGVRIRWADLGHRAGQYDDDQRIITLNLCLTAAQELSTAAHEWQHAIHRDRGDVPPHVVRAQEARADEGAARMLIDPEEYAAAERLVGSHPGALAAELGVCRWVVEAFQRATDHGRGWVCVPRHG